MAKVILMPSFIEWFEAQVPQLRKQVDHMLGMLEAEGHRMTEPWAKKLEGTQYAIFELRPARGNSPARVFYAFDIETDAIVVYGGVKTEANLYQAGIAATTKAITERNAALKKPRPATPKKGKKK